MVYFILFLRVLIHFLFLLYHSRSNQNFFIQRDLQGSLIIYNLGDAHSHTNTNTHTV